MKTKKRAPTEYDTMIAASTHHMNQARTTTTITPPPPSTLPGEQSSTDHQVTHMLYNQLYRQLSRNLISIVLASSHAPVPYSC